MKKAPVGLDDATRVIALRSYDVLDSTREDAYDAILRLVAETCQVPIGLITMIDDDRLWVKASYGPVEFRLDRAVSLCGHAICEPGDVFVVEDAMSDVRFYDNPIVVGEPFVRSYAGVPLVTNEGFALGTLCVMDVSPRRITDRERAILTLAARCVLALLEERRANRRLASVLGERRKLARDNVDLQGEIERRAAHEARLAFEVRHDELTKLPNRSYFIERLRTRISATESVRSRAPFGVMFVDIDHFKEVNDTYGHLVGDELLIAIARRLSHFVRGNDVVARLGGDEFTVFVDVVSDLESLAHLAERLGNAVAVPFRVDDSDVTVSASIGIVIATDAYARAEDVLRDADAAMFAAKAAGRNRFAFFGEARETS